MEEQFEREQHAVISKLGRSAKRLHQLGKLHGDLSLANSVVFINPTTGTADKVLLIGADYSKPIGLTTEYQENGSGAGVSMYELAHHMVKWMADGVELKNKWADGVYQNEIEKWKRLASAGKGHPQTEMFSLCIDVLRKIGCSDCVDTFLDPILNINTFAEAIASGDIAYLDYQKRIDRIQHVYWGVTDEQEVLKVILRQRVYKLYRAFLKGGFSRVAEQAEETFAITQPVFAEREEGDWPDSLPSPPEPYPMFAVKHQHHLCLDSDFSQPLGQWRRMEIDGFYPSSLGLMGSKVSFKKRSYSDDFVVKVVTEFEGENMVWILPYTIPEHMIEKIVGEIYLCKLCDGFESDWEGMLDHFGCQPGYECPHVLANLGKRITVERIVQVPRFSAGF